MSASKHNRIVSASKQIILCLLPIIMSCLIQNRITSCLIPKSNHIVSASRYNHIVSAPKQSYCVCFKTQSYRVCFKDEHNIVCVCHYLSWDPGVVSLSTTDRPTGQWTMVPYYLSIAEMRMVRTVRHVKQPRDCSLDLSVSVCAMYL